MRPENTTSDLSGLDLFGQGRVPDAGGASLRGVKGAEVALSIVDYLFE